MNAMNEYIKKEEIIAELNNAVMSGAALTPRDLMVIEIIRTFRQMIIDFPAADVQPLSVIAEHIKNRLYETAFNTSEVTARDTITDMAERIDFWIDELKDGAKNG